MLLITHIIIALTSLVFATYLLIRPSQVKLNMNYGLIAATIASGSYLIVTTGQHWLSACLSGLVYSVIAVSLSLAARAKLARQEA
ncbi:MAG TPA: hypothetical protein VFG56_00305 [Candidatus Saccharimonadales bacterium]|nr:hypothetical protein [Candidatus Saccharimonadales bacterium]